MDDGVDVCVDEVYVYSDDVVVDYVLLIGDVNVIVAVSCIICVMCVVINVVDVCCVWL